MHQNNVTEIHFRTMNFLILNKICEKKNIFVGIEQ